MSYDPFLRFCLSLRDENVLAETLVVAAHPDDEVIGAGAQLPKLEGIHILHVTDGAPRNMADASANGFSKREDYAAVRRRELQAALDHCGIPPSRLLQLGFADQEASFRLVDLTVRLAGTIRELNPDLVLCHAYEGGHPDHDATSFAAHAALTLLRREGRRDPLLMEFALYHASPDGMAALRFLPAENCPWILLPLSAGERSLKQRMIGCFKTQRKVLMQFPVSVEAFRLAPRYNFTRPPHPELLYYEKFDWGVNGSTWRAMAAEALTQLALSGSI